MKIRMSMYMSLLCIVNLTLVACAEVESSDLASERRTSNVPTSEETEGVIVGEFSAAATSDQVLVASQASKIADTAIIASPGALAIDAEIALQEGEDRGATLPAALGYDANLAILGGASPVHFDNAQSANVAGSLALEIPLPLDKAASGKTFALQDGDSGKVGVLSVYRTEDNTFKVSFEVLAADAIVGTFARVTAKGFGWYRLVFLSGAVSSAEADTQDEPAPAD